MDYDLIVIGAGNAGQAAATIAREAGWRVLVIESREVGGTCPLRGCVPKKVLVAAAELLDQIARAPVHRIRVGKAKLDWPRLVSRKQTFVAGVPRSLEKSLKSQGIDVIHGRARFVDRTTVAIGDRRFPARKVLVSSGSKPRALPI
ncbi:MAG: FAD-dependent oxidoreductase, partial [Candidatus Binatia bacterium]